MVLPAIEPVRILIVDPSTSQVEALIDLLGRSFGPRVTVVSRPSAVTSLDFLAHFSTDILIINARLPDAPGVDLCQRVRAMPGLTAVPIMLVDDEPSIEHRLANLASGADDTIARPIQDRLFLARLEWLWGSRGHGIPLRST